MNCYQRWFGHLVKVIQPALAGIYELLLIVRYFLFRRFLPALAGIYELLQ